MTDIRIAVLNSGVDPHPSAYRHTDIDGDRLLISTAVHPDGTPGLYFRTDQQGSTVPLDRLPELIDQLQIIADAARTEAADA